MALSDQATSPVMDQTLSVIDEHITDMHTPRHSIVAGERRGTNDSGSEYSSHVGNRVSYINGQETDEEEQTMHTEAEVLSWSPGRVAEYLEDVGVEKRHCDVFQEQEINGEVLLGMDQAQLFIKEFDLGPVGRRLHTWQKIKALQQEVTASRGTPKRGSIYTPTDDGASDTLRNRSTSLGTVLPRIPSLMESSGSARATSVASSHRQPMRSDTMPTIASPQLVSSPVDSSPRPSAASVRSLNHNRRHSSMDFTAAPPTPRSAASTGASPVVQSPHKKQPSLDRNWTMGGAKPPTNGRPLSSVGHGHSLSASGTQFDSSVRELGLKTVDPDELERGYFSGGEVDARNKRNVLRKKEGPHSRNSSYGTEPPRQSQTYGRYSRIGSADSIHVSPAAKAYFGGGSAASRATSGPDFTRPLTKELPPTVTKLEYGEAASIDAIASSPNIPNSETSSFGRASPSPALQSQNSVFGKKSRATGLRAISDAVTGTEKATAASSSDKIPSPVAESPMTSPIRTGSSTPSGTSKSFEFDPADMSKSMTGSSNSGATPLPAAPTRRKTKKDTSAYLRGLETKTPQEQMAGCDYSGWMKKKSSNLMTTWKTRLFVLRGRRLSYYYSESDKEEKGLIDISAHRVLPANTERLTGLHATITGATSSPSSPQNSSLSTTAATDAAAEHDKMGDMGDATGMFIFKLVPPRSGLSKAVNFTKPTVHYFAVDNVQQGRLWMAALMKATIDRDETQSTVSTYQQKTISLAKAQQMRQRPPALMDTIAGSEEKGAEDEDKEGDEKADGQGLAISGLNGDTPETDFNGLGEKRFSFETTSAATVPLPSSTAGSVQGEEDKKDSLSPTTAAGG